jgi:hypothetical protein
MSATGRGARGDEDQPRTYRRRSPSATRRGGRIREVRVIKEVSNTSFPLLTKGNYEEWSLVMKVKLQAHGLWEAVEEDDVDYQEDRMALEALLSAVPPEMFRPLAVKKTAKEAWAAIRSLHVGDDRVRKSTLQKMRCEWELLGFKEGEAVDDFALRLSGLMSSLAIYGEPVDEQRAVEKLLRVVPPKYSQIALSIETLLDTVTLSVEEVTGRLKAVDERSDAAFALEQPLLSGGKLYFTEEQWLAWMKEKGSGETSNRPPQQGGGGSSRQRQRRPRKNNNRQLDGRNDRVSCHNCGKLGHWAKDCHQPRRVQANLAQAEQVDEPALFMAQLTSLSSAPISKKPIYLDECNAHALLGAAGESEEVVDDGWYLDTGAMNHMTGRADVFANLDMSVQGTVKFGDDSFVKICGCRHRHPLRQER